MTQTSTSGAPQRLLVADAVAVHDHRRPVLGPTSLELSTGRLLVAVGDPGHGHTVLALALAGRLSGAAGTVEIDGSPRAASLQESVALVDVPGVSEPDEAVPLLTVAGEELAMAGRPARRSAVEQWLRVNRFGEHLGDRVGDLPAGVRVSLMCRLAALRPRVDFMVLALPERHGGLPEAWLGPVRELVAADFGVLVTASLGTARHLADEHGITVVELGNAGTAPEPEDPLPDAAYPPDIEQLAPTAPRAGAQETS